MTYTRTAAIAKARKQTTIHKSGGAWWITRNDGGGSGHKEYWWARTVRAQILIDCTLDLLGLTAEIQYTGGSWTTYIPKVTK